MTTEAAAAALPTTGWITLGEGAQMARVSTATLRREIRRGRLRYVRVGGRRTIRTRPEWIDAWLDPGSPVEATARASVAANFGPVQKEPAPNAVPPVQPIAKPLEPFKKVYATPRRRGL